jgi:RES domain-containing protein
MIVYRISSNNYAGKLQSSGIGARWNFARQNVIYTSESRALACLENVVHRSVINLSGLFKTQVIEIPDHLQIEVINAQNLPTGWSTPEKNLVCKELGSAWFVSGISTVLKVPSALIPKENNYIIHASHLDFDHIRLLGIEEFSFDPRIKIK